MLSHRAPRSLVMSTESSKALLILNFHMSNDLVTVANKKVQASIAKDDGHLECRVAMLSFVRAFEGLLQPNFAVDLHSATDWLRRACHRGDGNRPQTVRDV